MRVLIVGSGGREGALARAIAASPRCDRLWLAPGNPGTAAFGENLPIGAAEAPALAEFARREGAGLVVVGPEAPLALGLADELAARGIPCFGPRAEAARIETSKAFAKAFMGRWGIPTASARVFSEAAAAKAWAAASGRPLVVKASGQAAGKGVILPEGRAETEAAIDRLLALGGAGAEILLEERLEGEELSLFALSDGKDWALLPAARDHKRLLDGDRGPNTGGMGAYAPACSPGLAESLAELFIAPAIRGLAAEGKPFVGVLYAGLILTREGPRALEYNARFGDPEAQVLLPLFESDPLEAFAACAEGRLGAARPRFGKGSAACVVLASAGYPEAPEAGREIAVSGAEEVDSYLVEAATRREGEALRSAGGRVLSALGLGRELAEALDRAYAAAARVSFEGLQYRRDIGARGLLDGAVASSLAALSARAATAARSANAAGSAPALSATAAGSAAAQSAYAAAGVDIDAGNRAVELMKAAVVSTYGPEVLAGIGSFGGLYDASALKAMDRPVLVASTDGVGTKSSLAASLRRFRGLGRDMVNHSIDDILVQGGRPLFFLDYFAASRLEPEAVAEVVGGMAEACREAGCALLGGETAEMPGTYREGEIDVAGTIVGVVEAGRALPRRDLAAGDLLLGLASSGLHTNGYSLARRALAGVELEAYSPELGESCADALLRPHRSYLGALGPALAAEPSPVKALAHVTGGGFVENLPRILPPGLDAVVERGSWPVPPIFGLIARLGGVGEEEMARVFNLGIGMVAVVAPGELRRFSFLLSEEAFLVGRLEPGSGRARLA